MDGQHKHKKLDKSLHRNRGHINVNFCFYSFNFWSELNVKTGKNFSTGNLSQENCISIVFKALAVSLKGCNESGSKWDHDEDAECSVCVCVCLGIDICKPVLVPCRHHQLCREIRAPDSTDVVTNTRLFPLFVCKDTLIH